MSCDSLYFETVWRQTVRIETSKKEGWYEKELRAAQTLVNGGLPQGVLRLKGGFMSVVEQVFHVSEKDLWTVVADKMSGFGFLAQRHCSGCLCLGELLWCFILPSMLFYPRCLSPLSERALVLPDRNTFPVFTYAAIPCLCRRLRWKLLGKRGEGVKIRGGRPCSHSLHPLLLCHHSWMGVLSLEGASTQHAHRLCEDMHARMKGHPNGGEAAMSGVEADYRIRGTQSKPQHSHHRLHSTETQQPRPQADNGGLSIPLLLTANKTACVITVTGHLGSADHAGLQQRLMWCLRPSSQRHITKEHKLPSVLPAGSVLSHLALPHGQTADGGKTWRQTPQQTLQERQCEHTHLRKKELTVWYSLTNCNQQT